MLLQVPARVDTRCPRLWSLATAGGFLALAVLLAGIGLRVEAGEVPAPDADTPKKEEPKKPEVKKTSPATPDPLPSEPKKPEVRRVPDVPRVLVPGIPNVPTMDPDQFRAAQRAALQFGIDPFGNQSDGRLGVLVTKPSSTLVEQLDLPKGQGMSVEQVHADSAAAKAGLKAHDILLELNGKPVPDDVREFAQMVQAIKAKTPVDAVVMRKGKKETIKGLSLPEAKPRPEFPVFTAPPPFPGGFPAPAFPAVPNVGGLGGLFPGNGVMTTTFRSNDRFTTRHQEGSLIITVTGKVADGKAKVGEISVQDGLESHKYESMDKVAEKYQDKVKNLVEMSEKGAVKVEIKTP